MFVQNICAGESRSFFVDQEGNVWMSGLGVGHEKDSTQPKKIANLPEIRAVSLNLRYPLFLEAEGFVIVLKKRFRNIPIIQSISSNSFGVHSLLLDQSGVVWGLGGNMEGQLGTAEQKNFTKPFPVPNLPPIKIIQAGSRHSHFLAFDGTVWACGFNVNGDLGLGDFAPRRTAVQITTLPKIESLSSAFHSLFLAEDGTVWSCGRNQYGELGLGDKELRCKPTQITTLPKTIHLLSAGLSHSLFLCDTGKVWGCGSNHCCQLGFSADLDKIKTPKKRKSRKIIRTLVAGAHHSLFVDEEGVVWGCGLNEHGELGISGQSDGKQYSKLVELEGMPKIYVDLPQQTKSARTANLSL